MSNSKNRRGKLTAGKLQALAALGLEWAVGNEHAVAGHRHETDRKSVV